MKFTRIGAVVIDLDGTMFDTAPDFQRAINRMRANLSRAALRLVLIESFVGREQKI